MGQQSDVLSARSAAADGGAHGVTPVHLAVIGSLNANVLLQMSVFLPVMATVVPTDAKVVGIVQALVAVVGAWGLWNRRRWGRWTTLVVTLFNVLGSATALLDPPNGAVVAAVVLTLATGVPVIVLLWSRRLKDQLLRAATSRRRTRRAR